MASALKDVINAASGVSSFAVESARDLVQYFVRRGQMTQEEADKLLREAEVESQKRGRLAPPRVDGAKKAAAPPLPAITKSVVPLSPPPKLAPPPKTMPIKAPPPKPAPPKATQGKTNAASKAAPKAKAAAPKAAKPKASKKPAHKK